MLTLNTQILFKLLTKAIQPSNILDIGSMDGSDALALKKLAKKSNCFAFEANPHNFLAMSTDATLQKAGIKVIHKAVSNQDGVVSSMWPSKPTVVLTGAKGRVRFSKEVNLRISYKRLQLTSRLSH